VNVAPWKVDCIQNHSGTIEMTLETDTAKATHLGQVTNLRPLDVVKMKHPGARHRNNGTSRAVKSWRSTIFRKETFAPKASIEPGNGLMLHDVSMHA